MPLPSLLRRLPYDRKLIRLCVAVMALLVLLASALTLSYLRGQAEARIAVSTQNLARSLVQTFDGILDAIDIAVLAAGDEIARQRASGRPDRAAINGFLARQEQRLPVVPSLRATNAQGDIVYGVDPAGPVVSVADREYFTALR
ncbi:MAG TPA: hypothetical protein VIT92_00340, partial [Burkholderiaceae bacterium]